MHLLTYLLRGAESFLRSISRSRNSPHFTELYMFRTVPLPIINQEFFTVHTAMVYVIQVCWHLAWAKLYDI